MLINIDLILLDVDLSSKEEAILRIADLFEATGKLNDKERYIQDVYRREDEISTNLGDGIGMPHAKTEAVKEVGLAFIRLLNPIEWQSECCNTPVKVLFGIAVPENGGEQHLKILAQLARKLIYDEFKEKLFNVKDENELLAIIQEATKGVVS